jgi:hypothetical protein
MPEHKQHIHSQNHGENESEPRVQFAISRYKFCYHSHARHERNKDWNKLGETIKEFQLHVAAASYKMWAYPEDLSDAEGYGWERFSGDEHCQAICLVEVTVRPRADSCPAIGRRIHYPGIHNPERRPSRRRRSKIGIVLIGDCHSTGKRPRDDGYRRRSLFSAA